MIDYATTGAARNAQKIAREERARAIKNAWDWLFSGTAKR